MDNNQIRRKILKSLYEVERNTPGMDIYSPEIKQKLGIDDTKLNFNINYLENEGYIDVSRYADGEFDAKIKSSGINLVEDNLRFNKLFPSINFTQNIVQNSTGVVIGSGKVNVNIDESISLKESFINLYQEIEGQKNEYLIKNKLEELEGEFNKNQIDKSQVKKITDWLKSNANWTIPSIIQIISSALLYG